MSSATTAKVDTSGSTAFRDAEEIRLRFNRELLTTQIDQFIEVISSEGFIEYIASIADKQSYAERREMTKQTANLDTLREYGVPTPAGLRITTREFEIPGDGAIADGPLIQVRPGLDPRMGWCVSLGWFLCVSFGG